MRHEVGVSACAEFVQIQALAFALHRYALRRNPVEKPIQSIGQRQNKSEQRGDADQLRQPATRA